MLSLDREKRERIEATHTQTFAKVNDPQRSYIPQPNDISTRREDERFSTVIRGSSLVYFKTNAIAFSLTLKILNQLDIKYKEITGWHLFLSSVNASNGCQHTALYDIRRSKVTNHSQSNQINRTKFFAPEEKKSSLQFLE
jgi:hypothetical protein